MDKDNIDQQTSLYLSKGKRGPEPKLHTKQLVVIIHYRLKTGCQWRELPIKQFTEGILVGWNTIYHHFRRWCKDGSWRRVWTTLLDRKKTYLDLSSAQLDGSHTCSKGGGEAVGYQGRKASNTTNSLFIAANVGQMIAMSTPKEGSHHDLFEIERSFKEMIDQKNRMVLIPEEFFSMQILVLTLRSLGESVFEGKLKLTSKPIQEMTSMKIKKSITLMRNSMKNER